MKWMLSCLLAFPLLALAAGKTTPPIPLLIVPATGYWLDAERPGTGFSLQRRDGTLALAFYHFSDVDEGPHRTADWHLASGPLVGDTFEAPLAHFGGGSCLGCEPFVAAAGEQTDTVVRLVFASAREAMLQVGDAEPRRVVAMSYGVPYETALATPADVPLPDLRGRWVLRATGDRGMFRLEERIVADGALEYRGPASSFELPNASMRCGPEACQLWLDALPGTTPEPVFVATFLRGDITEERMTGEDSNYSHAQAFRIEDAEVQP